MLVSLWNQEFASTGNKVFWILRSEKSKDQVCKTMWNNSLVFLLPKVDKGRYSFVTRCVFFIKDFR